MKTRFRLAVLWRFAPCALFLFAGLAAAQEKVNAGSILPRVPLVTAENLLAGSGLVEALRRGGFVLYLRHTETGEISDDCNKTNLTEAGRNEAKRIGNAIRALRLPIDRVVSSDVCRVLETAKLMDVAQIEINEDLHRGPKRPDHKIHEARNRLLAMMPPVGSNRLLAGHLQAGETPEDRLFLEMGEIIVFRPVPGNRPVPVARVKAGEWQGLIEAAGMPSTK